MAFMVNFVSKMADLTQKREKLPSVRLLFGGRGIISDWRVPMRKSQLWHLYHNLTPGGRLILPDREVDMSPDKIYFIPCYLPFATAMTSKTMEHCYVDFEVMGAEFEMVEKRLFEFDAADYRHQLNACFSSGLSMLACCSLIFSLLNEIMPSSSLQNFDHVSDPRIRAVLNWIAESFAAQRYHLLSNEALSRKAGTSVGNFRHLFQRELKVSPQRYILRQKLDVALKLLLSSSLNIDEIAIMSGLGDRYQLTKHFVSEFKKPPARMRKDFLKKNSLTLE